MKATTIKLKQLVDMAPAIHALAATKLPAKISLRVARLVRAMQPELVAFDAERLERIKELGGIPSPDGQGYLLKEQSAQMAFNALVEDLLNEDIEMVFPYIHIDDLGVGAIEPQHLEKLLDVIVFEAPQPAASPTPPDAPPTQ